MSSGRNRYSSAPAGSAKALNQKPRPRRSKRETNQLLLLLFFVILPVVGLLAIFFQPIRWFFVVLAVLSTAAMWLLRGFKLPGRLVVTGLYSLLSVITLVTALSTSSRNTRQPFTQPVLTPMPTNTPAVVVSTMTGGYGAGDGMDVNSYGGGQAPPADFYEPEATAEAGYIPVGTKTEAEIALENFMEKWRKSIIADMVQYTSVAWRNAQKSVGAQDGAQQQLFWKFGQKTLMDWRQMSSPSGTEASTARTITIQADVKYGGELRTYEYEAIVLFEDGQWYVDPDSLASGTLVTKAEPTPDPMATPTPEPEPTPTPTINPKTQLYYNEKGGKRYHADKKCPSIRSDQYKYMKSFNYSDLGKNPYNKLTRCEKCDAPEK